MAREERGHLPWWQYLVVGLGHFLLGIFGDYVFCEDIHVTLGWPVMAWGVALLTFWGRRLWTAVLAGSLILHFGYQEPFGWPTLLLVLAEVGEVVIGSWVIGRGIDWSKGFRTVRQLRRGALVGLLVPWFGGVFGTWSILLSGRVEPDMTTAAAIFLGWWVRSSLGFWMVAPAIGAWFDKDREYLGDLPLEGAITSACVIGLTFFAFGGWFFLTPAPLWIGLLAGIPLIWAGARCGLWLSTHLVLIVLIGASYAALTSPELQDQLREGDLRMLWWLLLDASAAMAITLAVLNGRNMMQARQLSLTRYRLELLVQDSPLALIEWDMEFRVRRWSRRATEIFGFSAEEAIGLYGPDFLVSSEDRTLVMERWAMVLGGNAGIRSTNANLTATGEIIHCDWYGSPAHDERGQVVGVISLVEDVTGQLETERALAASERRFQSVAEVLPQLIAYYSGDLNLLFGNAAFLQAHGPEGEEIPKPLKDMVDAPTLKRILPNIQVALGGRSIRFLEKFSFQEGFEHDLDRVLLPDFDPEGGVRGFFSVCTDITEYRAAARERLALETQVLQTQKLESLGQLSGKIAHEFNNRLFGILGHADMACEDLMRKPDGARENLSKVIEIAREASDLCRQLFVYSGHGSTGKSRQGITGRGNA